MDAGVLPSRFFAPTYREAREAFVAEASAAGFALEAHRHPEAGAESEPLFMDVARLGTADAQALVVVSSACHGAEGFCGSGVQRALLARHDLLNEAVAAGAAWLFIHALNPWGYSHLRRTTHENVDLNRNFPPSFERGALPRNAGYDALADVIVPSTWPPGEAERTTEAAFIAERGLDAFQAAVSGGQYHHPDGLFFGGHAPTWSHRTLLTVLAAHAQRCRRMAWIDVHTGLGPSGHAELIHAAQHDPVALARARAWWGDEAVTSTDDGTSTSAPLVGLMWDGVRRACPQAEATGIAMEVGTLSVPEVLGALRADQWLHRNPNAPAAQRAAIKRQMRDAFYVDTLKWKADVVRQGVEVAQRAVAGIAGGGGDGLGVV